MMDSQAAEKSIGQLAPMAHNMLDYTDNLFESCSDEHLDVRFTDPKGGYFFSAREVMMHVADTRWQVLSWIDGNDYSEHIFLEEFGGKEKPWKFKEEASLEKINASMKASRAVINELLGKPASYLPEITDSLLKSFEKRVAGMKEKGLDTTEVEAAGPTTILNSIIFLVSHEQSHRTQVQWLMREHGHEVYRFA